MKLTILNNIDEKFPCNYICDNWSNNCDTIGTFSNLGLSNSNYFYNLFILVQTINFMLPDSGGDSGWWFWLDNMFMMMIRRILAIILIVIFNLKLFIESMSIILDLPLLYLFFPETRSTYYFQLPKLFVENVAGQPALDGANMYYCVWERRISCYQEISSLHKKLRPPLRKIVIDEVSLH